MPPALEVFGGPKDGGAKAAVDALVLLLDELENKMPIGDGRLAWLNPAHEDQVEGLVEIFEISSTPSGCIGINEILGRVSDDGKEFLTINEGEHAMEWLMFLADARNDMRRLISACRDVLLNQ